MPASLQGELQPTIYRFKLGGFEAATILDCEVVRDGLHPMYGANGVGRRGAGARPRQQHRYQPLRASQHSDIVNTGKELVLFDTGNGALPREYEQLKTRMPAGNLVSRLGQAGYKPEDIDVVVLDARPSRSHRRPGRRRQAGVS